MAKHSIEVDWASDVERLSDDDLSSWLSEHELAGSVAAFVVKEAGPSGWPIVELSAARPEALWDALCVYNGGDGEISSEMMLQAEFVG